MKILDAKIHWHDGFTNNPELMLLVDDIPSVEYAKRGRLYFGELGGYVHFLCSDPHNHTGFGGAEFKLDMIDGSKETLVGPWSSRSSVMNEAGFTPCMEACLTTDKKAFDRGYTFMAGHITVEKAKEALIHIQGSSLVKTTRNGETYYLVTKCGIPESIEIVENR